MYINVHMCLQWGKKCLAVLNKKLNFQEENIINACMPLLYHHRVNIMSAGRFRKVSRRKTQ